jgi:ribosome-associated protein
VYESSALTDITRARVISKLANRLTAAGELVITSDRYRDQGKNRDDCIEKLFLLLQAALTPPTPRKKTRPTRSSVRRKQENKKRQSQKKLDRRGVY